MEVDVRSVTPQNIQRLIGTIRSDGSSGVFELETERSPLSGKQCWIFLLSFQDNQSWAVRVPVKSSHLPSISIKNIINCEIEILSQLTKSDFLYSPKLIAYDTSFDNALKFPYVVLKWIEGKPLQWSENIPASNVLRSKIIRDMVSFNIDLARSTVYDSGMSASQHLIRALDRRITRVLKGELPENKLRDCLVLRILVKRAFNKSIDTSLCMVSHNDLAPQNIIIDNDNNVKGIIDWGFAEHVPLPLGLSFPRFLSIEPPIVFEKHMLGNQMFSSQILQPSATLQRDRREYLSYLEALDDVNQDEVSKYALSHLSKAHYDWHQLIFEAIHSKGLLRWLAQHEWLYPGPQDIWNDIDESQISSELENSMSGEMAHNQINRNAAFEFYRRELLD